jgi:hypothetical protein
MRGVVAILFLSYAAVYVVGALADPAQKRDATFDDFPQGAPVVFLPGVIGLSESPVVREFRALYSDCAISAALVMARISPEPAEVIARAAVGKCAAERERYLTAVSNELKSTSKRDMAADEEHIAIESLTAHVIAARAPTR